MKRWLASLVLSWGFCVGPLALADCTAVINDAYAWAAKKDGRNRYDVSFLISSMKAPTKFVHYSQGAFVLGTDGLLSSGPTGAVFSDRAWCPNNSGPFCLPYQKFDYRKADQMTFVLEHSGVLKVVLNTWGNATYNINLQCSNGFLYGTLVEPNGNSFLMMNLNKTSVEIPR
jgi:hypothetical protein